MDRFSPTSTLGASAEDLLGASVDVIEEKGIKDHSREEILATAAAV